MERIKVSVVSCSACTLNCKQASAKFKEEPLPVSMRLAVLGRQLTRSSERLEERES